MIALVLVGLGFLAGLAIGRWWALALSVPSAVWIGATTEVEVGGLFLGAGYGLLIAVGIALGVVARQHATRGSRSSS
jgi:hypothetical protein